MHCTIQWLYERNKKVARAKGHYYTRARAYVCIGHGAGQRVAKLPIGFLIHGAAMLLVSDDFYTCKPFFFSHSLLFFPYFFCALARPSPVKRLLSTPFIRHPPDARYIVQLHKQDRGSSVPRQQPRTLNENCQ